MKIADNASIDVNTHGGGDIPPCTGLTPDALPEVQEPILAENSQTGVSTRNTLLGSTLKTIKKKQKGVPHWYALRATYGREKKTYDYLVGKHVEVYYPTIKTYKGSDLPDDYQNQKARDKHEETCPYRSANKDDNSGEQNQGTDPAVNVGGSSGGSGSHSHGDNSENKNTWSGLSKAITKLNSNALSLEDYKKKGKGECAKYVRIAIQAGGIDTSDHPIYAKNYGPYLIRWGFKEIPCTDYIPKTGDIRVWQNYPGGNIAGHIDMFNGTGWVSDFFEPNPSGPNSKYRKYKKFKIYRK